MEETNRKSWFSRNWPWVIPVGGCLTIIILFVLGVGTLFFGVTKMLKSSAPYEYALTEASNNHKVIDYLGQPIEPDGIINGNLSLNNNDGEADFVIPIKGPKGKAKIIVIGVKTDGEWVYESLFVTIKGTQEKINLLKKDLEGI